MKKRSIPLLFFVIWLVLPGTVNGQTVIYADFEEIVPSTLEATPDPASWSIIENTDISGLNTSATCGKFVTTSSAWDLILFEIDPIIPEESQVFKLLAKGPAGTVLKLKLQNEANNSAADVDYILTKDNEWENCVFDLSDLVAGKTDLSVFVLFINFNNTDVGLEVMVDDIKKQTDHYETIANFEDVEPVGLESGAPGAWSVVENTDNSGINPTASTGKYITTASAWDLIKWEIEAIDPGKLQVYKLLVKAPTGAAVRLKLQNATNTDYAELEHNVSLDNQWEELTFDMTSLVAGKTDLTGFILFVDFGNSTAGREIYVDQIHKLMDVSSLQDAIELAEEQVANASIGNAPGEYKQTVVDEANAVIATAKSAYSTALTQTDIENAAADLELAMESFLPNEAPTGDGTIANFEGIMPEGMVATPSESALTQILNTDNSGLNPTDSCGKFVTTSSAWDLVLFEVEAINSLEQHQYTLLVKGPAGATLKLKMENDGNSESGAVDYILTQDNAWEEASFDLTPEILNKQGLIKYVLFIDFGNGVEGREFYIDEWKRVRPVLDLSVLYNTISEATEKVNAAVIGTEAGHYFQATVDDANAAIDAAKLGYAADTQVELDEVIEALNVAMASFRPYAGAVPEGMIANFEGITPEGIAATPTADAFSVILNEDFEGLNPTDSCGLFQTTSSAWDLVYFEVEYINTFKNQLYSLMVKGPVGATLKFKMENAGNTQSGDVDYILTKDNEWEKAEFNLSPAVVGKEGLVKYVLFIDFGNNAAGRNFYLDELQRIQPVLSITQLYAAITDAVAAVEAAVVGSETGQYLQEVVDAANAAIEVAKQAYSLRTQQEVDDAVAALTTAMESFVPIANLLDFDSLETAISNAESAISSAVIGTAEGEYLQEVVDAAQAAVDIAKEALNSATTQVEVDDAEAALLEAMAAYVANGPTGISNYLAAVHIYPNPTHGEIRFNPEAISELAIFDVMGKEIMFISESITGTVDMSSLNNGIYFIRLKDEASNTRTFKIMKQ